MTTNEYISIYPAYINANRTVREGRRLPKNVCVTDPKWQEIRDILEASGRLQILVEPNKIYPREVDKEAPQNRGRVKVKLLATDEKFKNKEAIMKHLIEMIPKLKSRAKGGNQPGDGQAAAPAPTAGSKKKKGKRN